MLVLAILLTGEGCATFRLNGCSRLASCGELAAYACGEDLVCADADGRTIRSDFLAPSRNHCLICQGGP
jgi:hypothetical protein